MSIKTYLVLALFGALYFTVVNCQGDMDIRTAQYYTHGHKLYQVHCANCHGLNGEGLGKLYPPLTDTNSISAHRNQLPQFIRYGIKEPMNIAGEIYDVEMPPNAQLSKVDIAYILTYITNSFGNQQGIYTEDEVEKHLAQ
jgi:mono/diheme cytochrome c family protein